MSTISRFFLHTEKVDILNGQFQKDFSEKTSISNEEFQIQCKMTGKFNTIKDITITENPESFHSVWSFIRLVIVWW
jgi:hypothetical protein